MSELEYAVMFRVKSQNSKGRYLPDGDGMRRAMALVLELGATRLTPTLITGRDVSEVTVTCAARPLPGNDLDSLAAGLCERYGCEYELGTSPISES